MPQVLHHSQSGYHSEFLHNPQMVARGLGHTQYTHLEFQCVSLEHSIEPQGHISKTKIINNIKKKTLEESVTYNPLEV